MWSYRKLSTRFWRLCVTHTTCKLSLINIWTKHSLEIPNFEWLQPYLTTQQRMSRCCGTYWVLIIRLLELIIHVKNALRRRDLSSTLVPSHIRSMLGVFQLTGSATTSSNEGRLVLRLTTHSFTGTWNFLFVEAAPAGDGDSTTLRLGYILKKQNKPRVAMNWMHQQRKCDGLL